MLLISLMIMNIIYTGDNNVIIGKMLFNLGNGNFINGNDNV